MVIYCINDNKIKKKLSKDCIKYLMNKYENKTEDIFYQLLLRHHLIQAQSPKYI